MRLVEWGASRGLGLEAQAVLTSAFPRPDVVLDELLSLGFETVSMKPVLAGFGYSFSEGKLEELFASYDTFFVRLSREVRAGRATLLAALKGDLSLRPLWKLAFGVSAESRCIWGTTHIVADSAGDFYPCDSVLGMPEDRCGSLEAGID